MPTPVANSGIVARAFELLELRPISSVADDDDLARAAGATLIEARQLVLSLDDWAAVIARAPLMAQAGGGAALTALDALYPMPSDCLVPREVTTADGWRVTWQQEGRSIRADAASDLVLRYTADTDREADLPAYLRQVVALQMAVLMCDRQVTSTAKKQALIQQLDLARAEARRADARTASSRRYDGRDEPGDWVAEAVL